jgi:hypothetical protein
MYLIILLPLYAVSQVQVFFGVRLPFPFPCSFQREIVDAQALIFIFAFFIKSLLVPDPVPT